jgi:hypothetical protein
MVEENERDVDPVLPPQGGGLGAPPGGGAGGAGADALGAGAGGVADGGATATGTTATGATATGAGAGGASGGDAGTAARTGPPEGFWWIPYLVGAAVLITYGVLLSKMFGKVGYKDLQWTRMTYLFTGVESLAFAAAGFFFGREVNRGRAEAAESRAKTETARATTAEKEATVAKTQVKVLRGGLEELADGATRSQGAPRGVAPQGFAPEGAPFSAGVDPEEIRRLTRLADLLSQP